MKPRLGCLSFSGILAAVVTAAIIIGIGLTYGGGLFSPGPLNAQAGEITLGEVRSHAEILQCSHCHTALWEKEKMGDRCVACHTDLANDPKDFHNVMRAAGEEMGCRRCHTDHRGKDASLTVLDLTNFPHNKIGYALTAHQQMQDGSTFSCTNCHGNDLSHFDRTICTDCHQELDVAFVQAHTLAFGDSCLDCHDGVDSYGKAFDHNQITFHLEGKHADLACGECHAGARSIIDLQSAPTSCFDCHAEEDAHAGRLGRSCAVCHTPSTWQDANLDHSLTQFPLVGQHTSLECKSCHVEGPEGMILHGTPTDCYSCHAESDPHAGKLGTDCAQCHTPNAWDQVSYDHALATFKLDGQHTTVACDSCHTDLFFVDTPQDCASCHSEDDPHAGKLGADCAKCHTTSGWEQANFDHALAAFKLDGKHTTVACKSCHSDLLFKGTPKDCFSCHSQDDPHAGNLGTNCAGCHTSSGWNDVNFDHSTVAFQLTGKHATTACDGCHSDLLFVGTPTLCYACHSKDDHHEGQFGTNCDTCHNTSDWATIIFDHSQADFTLSGAHATTACLNCHAGGVFEGTPQDCYACHSQDDEHDGQFGTSCGSCHDTTDWGNATFDHSKAAFPLTGKHTSAACTSCHTDGVFKGTPQDCYACHSQDDDHSGQYGQSCGSCHTTSGWEGATFDHALSSFPLTGKHSSVACTSCHVNGVYKGTSTVCYACHAEPDYHLGVLGTECASCHTTSGWLPASFNGAHSFPFNHGEDNNTCHSCHPGSLDAYTCYACHDAGEMASEHSDEGISDLSDCLSCHPTGNKEDGDD